MLRLICLFIFSSSLLFSVTSEIKITMIIPCVHTHIKYLSSLLESIENQTLIPDEVVISASQLSPIDKEELERLEEQSWPFDLEILTTTFRRFAGENRNIAIKNSTGDLIICQDADDYPHPERVEIIKDVFEKTNFDLLVHSFAIKKKNPDKYGNNDEYISEYTGFSFVDKNYCVSPLVKIMAPNPGKFFQSSELIAIGVHCGNCVFSRRVFNDIQYSSKRSGQDVEFVRKVMNRYKNKILLELPLVFYVRSRSSKAERIK